MKSYPTCRILDHDGGLLLTVSIRHERDMQRVLDSLCEAAIADGQRAAVRGLSVETGEPVFCSEPPWAALVGRSAWSELRTLLTGECAA